MTVFMMNESLNCSLNLNETPCVPRKGSAVALFGTTFIREKAIIGNTVILLCETNLNRCLKMLKGDLLYPFLQYVSGVPRMCL